MPTQIPKNEKVGSGENTKNVGESTSGREMRGVTPAASNQPFLQEQGIPGRIRGEPSSLLLRMPLTFVENCYVSRNTVSLA